MRCSPSARTVLLGLLLALAACRAKGERAVPAGRAPAAGAAFDWSRPATALAIGAGEAAAQLGSFEQVSAVSWSVGRGAGSRTVTTSERHRVRQLAGGEFEAESELDPGGGPGTETGRHVVWSGGMTYGRSRGSQFRERPTDRGRDARRFRDESFRLAGDLAALCGPALELRPAGSSSVLGRPAKRYHLALAAAMPAAAAAPPPGRSADPDTRARLELLEGAVPLALDGEVDLDAATGVPLAIKLHGAFGVAGDPALRAEVSLDAQMTALGALVDPVRTPKEARPDERKPNGPARALEAAGLRERGKPVPGEAEPGAPEDEPAE